MQSAKKENLKDEWQEKMDGQYVEAVGRRKTATARIRIFEADKDEMIINGSKADEHFPTEKLRLVTRQALLGTPDREQKFFVSVHVKGGGIAGQAEAIRLGTARALVEYDEELKAILNEEDLLHRDPRSKERKKPGKKKARKSEQFSKR